MARLGRSFPFRPIIKRAGVITLQPRSITVSDSTTTSESISVAIVSSGTLAIAVSDSTTTSENVVVSIVAIAPLNITVSDSTTTSENIGRLLVSFITVSDTTTTTENVVPLITGPDLGISVTPGPAYTINGVKIV